MPPLPPLLVSLLLSTASDGDARGRRGGEFPSLSPILILFFVPSPPNFSLPPTRGRKGGRESRTETLSLAEGGGGQNERRL